MALLEEVCHFEDSEAQGRPKCLSLPADCRSECRTPYLLLQHQVWPHVTMLPSTMLMDSTSETISKPPTECVLLYEFCGHGVSSQ